ncbi:MAG: NUDIX domain-containing protein [Methylomonas sp.]|jgi:ADP-ribose pyrophosphatase
MTGQFEIIEHKTVYHGFFHLERYTIQHTLFAGGWSQPLTRELFRRNNCVAVLLYDPLRDEVVLIEQFRVGAVTAPQRAWLLEIVAGAMEEGETAAEVACRETLEESGCTILELREIMQFYTTPGGSSERITMFYGRVDSTQAGGLHGLAAEGEDILVRAVKAEEAFMLMASGRIESAIPLLALQWLYINRDSIRRPG